MEDQPEYDFFKLRSIAEMLRPIVARCPGIKPEDVLTIRSACQTYGVANVYRTMQTGVGRFVCVGDGESVARPPMPALPAPDSASSPVAPGGERSAVVSPQQGDNGQIARLACSPYVVGLLEAIPESPQASALVAASRSYCAGQTRFEQLKSAFIAFATSTATAQLPSVVRAVMRRIALRALSGGASAPQLPAPASASKATTPTAVLAKAVDVLRGASPVDAGATVSAYVETREAMGDLLPRITSDAGDNFTFWAAATAIASGDASAIAEALSMESRDDAPAPTRSDVDALLDALLEASG